MRIVELTIDLLDELTGFDTVALVNQPAIESGFHAFKDADVEDAIAFQLIKLAIEEQFVDRLPGESQDDYLGRCIPKLLGEGYDQDQAAAICYETMNTEEEVSQEFSLFEDLPTVTQDKLIERLRALGISMESLEGLGLVVISEEEYNKQTFGLPTKSSANPEESTSDVNGRYKILYQYSGPKDGKNRDFCRRVLDLGMLFRKEDISKLTITGANSEEFGYYDIFEYKGSFGCRHRWNKVYVYQKQGGLSALETAALLMDENRKKVEAVKFSEQKEYKFATDQDHQIVVGPLMIPDKLIFRVDSNNEPYYTYFSRETIVNLANKMMKNKLLDRMNLEHDPDSPVEGFMLENWIVTDEEHDKSKAYGLDVPVGTWMGMYKIEDPTIWEMVKKGIVKAFSIEGYFLDRLVQH